MALRSLIARLSDIVEAIERVQAEMIGVVLEAFESDWRKRWVVERGIEIISEASRYLTPELKARYPEVPWPKVAGIGNVLRHDYRRAAPEILWNVAREDLPPLERACRDALAAELARERRDSPGSG